MVMPVIVASNEGPKFFFNLSGNVGPRSPNRPDDVQFVQLAYTVMAKRPDIKPDLREVFAKVVAGSPYSGGPSEPLSLAIKAHEAARGGTQDGHVSVFKGTEGTYDGKNTYMALALNNSLRGAMPDDFPRIDKLPQCPLLLRQTVRGFFLFK